MSSKTIAEVTGIFRFLNTRSLKVSSIPAIVSFFLSEFDPKTHFTPYIDVESDDIDQIDFAKAHPEKANAGERSFSLDSYPAPGTQRLIEFYPDGEPSYATVRADVFATLRAKPLSPQ